MGKKNSVLPVAHVAALTQLVRFAPDAFEQKSEIIMTYLSKRILMIPITPVRLLKVHFLLIKLYWSDLYRKENQVEDEDEDGTGDWVENEEISDELRAKILALKVCRNRCLAHTEADNAAEIATPVLKMLATLVEHEGSLVPNVAEEYA